MRSISIFFIVAMVFLQSCGNPKQHSAQVPETTSINGIYFWKTRFELNDYEKSFLKEHDIKRLYVRFFDVDDNMTWWGAPTHRIEPIATTDFVSAKPEGVEIVPCVFLTTRAVAYMEESYDKTLGFARRIVTRVRNMADYNDLGPLSEIQLDCDWTESTREAYYKLCSLLSYVLKDEGIAVSSTIRLHQLRTDAPPVDRGVLMLYNTGSHRSASEENSIISKAGVAAYLQGRRISYGIPLDFAYPDFGWGLVFRGDYFCGILHQTDYSDGSLYKRQEDGTYRVLKGHTVDDEYVGKDCTIRVEGAPANTILEVKDLVQKAFPDVPHSNIIYHLDSLNLSKYTADEITSIYSD